MGTAAVMLGAALALFAFVGTLVSFGAWPGLSSHEKVDSLLVESVSTRRAEPLRIAERPRTSPRSQAADAARRAAGLGAPAPAAGVPVTSVPGLPTTPAPAPAPAGGGGSAPEQAVTQAQPQPVIDRTTDQVGGTVETVTQQTNEIVGEVGGQVQRTLDPVEKAAGGLLR